MNVFFLRGCFLKIIFPWRRPLKFFFLEKAFCNSFYSGKPFEIYFFLERALRFFFLYKPIKKVPNFFFSHVNSVEIIFPEEDLLNLFFLRKAS